MKCTNKRMQTCRQLMFATLIAAFSLSSCVPVYRANTLFMPAFENKGDIVAEASLGSGDLSINAGYAMTENLAITAGYQNRSLDDRISASYFYEMGMGWFSQRNNSISSEVLGSFGYGQFDYNGRYRIILSDSHRQQFINTNYLRTALQYNMHFHVHPLTFSLGSRFVYAHFNDFEDLIIRESDGAEVSRATAHNFARTYLEPMGTITVNVHQVSIFAQGGVVFLMHGDTNIFGHDAITLNFGIRFRMNQFKK